MPLLKNRDMNSPADAAPASPSSAAENPANRQTVALEVPVTVNGARPLEGSEKREPFSESTKTVLVFSNGAVIRLASAVAAGQLLFLTNEKTKKEVVCQVVKSKTYSNVSGYVELQFSEPVAGFWGVRFPSERAASSEGSGLRANLVGATAKIAAEQFKTELKADDRSSNRAELLTAAEPSTEALKVEANRLQEQLSALMFEERPSASKSEKRPLVSSERVLSDTTAKLFEIAESKESEKAAPTLAATVKANLPAEEVKIPSWLEPLARNAATPAPPAETVHVAEATAPKETKKLQTPKSPAKATSGKAKAVAAAPVFGRTLLGPSGASSASHGGHKTLIFAIATGLAVAAAGATWYLWQPSSPWPGTGGAAAMNSGPAISPAASAPASTVVPASSTATAESSGSAAQTQPGNPGLRTGRQTPRATPASSIAPSASSSLGPAQVKAQPAVISERVPSAAASPLTASATADSGAEAVEPEAKRAGLGKVRLAKPKVNRTRQAGIAEPTLGETEGQAVPESGSLGGALVGENSPQPTAPAPETPIGGDVNPARLVSSVPPVYPALAKAQHVAGDVRIDALIDATGRVSSMKVVSGPTLLHTAAMEALRKWRYQPATLDGNAVSMHLTVTIQFRLH